MSDQDILARITAQQPIDPLQRITGLLDDVSDRLVKAEAEIKELKAYVGVLEKWQDNAAPVLQQVRARWHLPGPRCQVHGKRNCALCFERGLTT